MALRQRLNQVEEKPLPLEVCRNSSTLIFMRSPCREDELLLLLHRKSSVRWPGNLERRWSLSLYNSLSLPFLSFSFFLFLWITLNRIFRGNFVPLSYMPHAFSLIFLPFSLFLYSLCLRFCSQKDKTKLGLIPFLF